MLKKFANVNFTPVSALMFTHSPGSSVNLYIFSNICEFKTFLFNCLFIHRADMALRGRFLTTRQCYIEVMDHLLYNHLHFISKRFKSQERNDKVLLSYSESKPGATEEEVGCHQLGWWTEVLSELFICLSINCLTLTPFPHHPAHILRCVIGLLRLHFQSLLSYLFFFLFFWITRYSHASCGVWQVHPIFTRHSRCLSSPGMLMLVLK